MSPHRIVSGKKIAGPDSSPSTARDMDETFRPYNERGPGDDSDGRKHSFALQLRNQGYRKEKDLLSSQNW